MNEKITILIPTFNRQKYITECMKSAVGQSYPNLEILVYDDGSTDDTPSILDGWAGKYENITVIKNPVNKGVGYARNVLLDVCNTELACWLDSDDVIKHGRVELQYKLLKDNPKVNRVFCKWTWFKRTGGMWHLEPKDHPSLAFATLLFRVDKSIKFNPLIKLGGEDWDWVERMRDKYPAEMVVPELLYHVRMHSERIGSHKRIFRDQIPKELLGKLSYKEMIEYYHKGRMEGTL